MFYIGITLKKAAHYGIVHSLVFSKFFMRKFALLSSLIFVGCFVVLSTVHAQGIGEQIDNFIVDIKIKNNGSISVTETIRYNFGSEDRHGIYREIPYKYVYDNGDQYNVRITAVSVTDGDDREWEYTTYKLDGYLTIKIGDPDKYISGKHTYVITYVVERALGFYSEYDELYWDVIGNEWEIPIIEASITVQVEKTSFDDSQILADCYTGLFGASDKNCSSEISNGRAIFKSTKKLQAYEGMSIVFGWPKDFVANNNDANNPPVLSAIGSQTVDEGSDLEFSVTASDADGDIPILSVSLLPGDSSFYLDSLGEGMFSWAPSFSDAGSYQVTFYAEDDIIPEDFDFEEVIITVNDTTLFQYILRNSWPLLIPLIVIGLMVYVWYTRGRDPRVRSTVIPLYEAPDSLPAGELGTIVDEKVDLHDISATIIQLAVKGYIKIKEIGKEKAKRDYELIKLKEPDKKLDDYEKKIIDGIFGSSKTKKISDLKNKFYTHLPGIKKAIYALVVSDGYFPTNPEKVRNGYVGISIFFLIIGIGVSIFILNIIVSICVLMTGIFAILFSRAMPRKTKKGAETHVKIEGFKWFLSVTETERLKFHNAPERSPKQFEEFLPYAMVLGVEKEWADQFKSIYLSPPEWYHGSPGTAFGAVYLVSSLASLTTTMGTTMVSRPGSSGSGGSSGFSSGGGFSGGGFGGGGGGSW